VHGLLGGLGNGPAFVTPTILWALFAATGAIVIATAIAVGSAWVKARRAIKEPVRPVHHINPACAAGGHKYQTYGTGYRCATCGNYVSSAEGELYGRVEDGRHERRRHPR
jgi:tRNA(Ile2) C34 agmatinyltransferase TiaS